MPEEDEMLANGYTVSTYPRLTPQDDKFHMIHMPKAWFIHNESTVRWPNSPANSPDVHANDVYRNLPSTRSPGVSLG